MARATGPPQNSQKKSGLVPVRRVANKRSALILDCYDGGPAWLKPSRRTKQRWRAVRRHQIRDRPATLTSPHIPDFTGRLK